MSSLALYIHRDTILTYPRKALTFEGGVEDVSRVKSKSTKSIGIGDFILPTKLRRFDVEQIFDEFSRETKSTAESVISLLLFAIGVFEDEYLIVNQVSDVQGYGHKGHVCLKPYYVVPSDEDGEPPLMMELTYSYSGEMKRTMTLRQLQEDMDRTRALSSSSALLKGFGEISMLLAPSPGQKIGMLAKPIAEKVAKKASRQFFLKLPVKVVNALNNRVSRWCASLATKLAASLAKNFSKDLFQQHQRMKSQKGLAISVEKGKVVNLTRSVIRSTITEVVAKDIVEILMGSLHKTGFASARRELQKQVEVYMTNRFVERVLDVTVTFCISTITSIPVAGDEKSYASHLEASIKQKLTNDNKLNSLFRSEFESALKDVVRGKMNL